MNESELMQIALNLAAKGAGYTAPNPMVGALVVSGGEIVGKGYHQAVGGAHAEVNAIDDAGTKAKDATLVVTLEPCNHVGRTPPCTAKIIAAGIRRVVIAMRDPNAAVAGGGIEALQRAGIDVQCGICEQEALRLNEAFVKFCTTGRPFVIAKCAATLDGRIATRSGDARWISGPNSRAFVHRLRHAVDAIMVGIGTVLADNPSLTTRIDGRKGRDPLRVILDTHLRIPPNAQVLQQRSDAQTVVIAGEHCDPAKGRRIESTGARVLAAPIDTGRIDLAAVAKLLGGEQVSSLLIEGGAGVLGSAFGAGIVDKVHFFYAPKIMGGDDGVPICSGPGPERMDGVIGVKQIDIQRFDDDVMLTGYI